MRLTADFHSHSTYCDGRNSLREMVEAAYRKGFTDFGVSSHGDMSFCIPGFGMKEDDFERYKEELHRLKDEYRGRMNVYTGVELDTLGPVLKAEYAIGSTHCILKDGVYAVVDNSEEEQKDYVNRLWKGDWYAFVRDYYETEAEVYERTDCDWVGHFDLVTKFNQGGRYFDETADEYLEPALAAMRKLNEQGLPFEINTGAISRGYRKEPYPSKNLLKELKAMGGRIIINSDSHWAEAIGCCFDQAAGLAAECGFEHTWVLTPKGGFRRVPLEEGKTGGGRRPVLAGAL